MFRKLRRDGNSFHVTSKKYFIPNVLNKQAVEKALIFSYYMTFGKIGEHRNYRTGGQYSRKNGELFCNTFQGKLAEYAFYFLFRKNGINISEPDLETWKLGKWDETDFEFEEQKISIKSVAFFSNLLLLEVQDWDNTGKYIPNGLNYDYTVLIRLKPDIKQEFRKKKWFYKNSLELVSIKELVMTLEFHYDIPGFITNDDLVYLINNEFVIPQNSFLNGSTKMDASNYYAQVGDLRPISDFNLK